MILSRNLEVNDLIILQARLNNVRNNFSGIPMFFGEWVSFVNEDELEEMLLLEVCKREKEDEDEDDGKKKKLKSK